MILQKCRGLGEGFIVEHSLWRNEYTHLNNTAIYAGCAKALEVI